LDQLPSISISEQWAQAFARPQGSSVDALPVNMQNLCDALLVDVAGLCVAARHSDYVAAIHRASMEPGVCTVIGHAGLASVAGAALINGTATHGEDYDDTFEGGPIHAGAVVVPGVLAAAQFHRLSGADLAWGIAVGSEVMCRLCSVAPKKVHQAGFHPTAVFGALGAAAGVASALSLSPVQWMNALGIAGSMASGIIEYLAEGAWTKRMHPGWSAQAGYRAARLAQEGFTGPRTLFEGTHGFFHAFANTDDGLFEDMLANAGEHWLSADMAFKPYACGTMAHPYIDCARALVKGGLKVQDIDRIECKTAHGIVHRLWEPLAAKQQPINGYAAKFSIPYAVAVGLLRGDAGLVEYEPQVVHDEQVRNLARKVSYVIDPDNPYPQKFTGHVRVTLKNGHVLEATQDHFRGGKEDPMSQADLHQKFFANCAYGGWSPELAQSALTLLLGMRHAAEVDAALLGQ
jgi:2-methylcitrate dehydratase PrpD